MSQKPEIDLEIRITASAHFVKAARIHIEENDIIVSLVRKPMH